MRACADRRNSCGNAENHIDRRQSAASSDELQQPRYCWRLDLPQRHEASNSFLQHHRGTWRLLVVRPEPLSRERGTRVTRLVKNINPTSAGDDYGKHDFVAYLTSVGPSVIFSAADRSFLIPGEFTDFQFRALAIRWDRCNHSEAQGDRSGFQGLRSINVHPLLMLALGQPDNHIGKPAEVNRLRRQAPCHFRWPAI